MSSSKEEEEAKRAIQDAKSMIRDGKYKNAKAKIQETINVFPTIKYGRELITLCEILQTKILSNRNLALYSFSDPIFIHRIRGGISLSNTQGSFGYSQMPPNQRYR